MAVLLFRSLTVIFKLQKEATMSIVEVIKNIGTVVGCIISCITLLSLLIKPIRQFIISKITKLSNKDIYDIEIKKQSDEIAKEKAEIQEIKTTCNEIVDNVSEIKSLVFQNESDRLRGELFSCGNRCRRNIPLSLEEFRYIQEVYQKYSEKLHCNSIGTEEYEFIKAYYYSIDNQSNIKS